MGEITVFIGSSSEKLPEARAVQEILIRRGLKTNRWDLSSTFESEKSILEGLLRIAQESDAAVFVFGADDVTRIRDEEHRTVRDNVLFEHGLFMGRLGRGFSFLVVPQDKDVRIPTNLLGIQHCTYRPPGGSTEHNAVLQALTPACEKIADQLYKKCSPHRVEATYHGCRISLEAGDILRCHTGVTAVVYPVNLYFDTTDENAIVDRDKSTFGLYLRKRVGCEGLGSFDQALDSAIGADNALKPAKIPPEMTIPKKPGRQTAFRVGSTISMQYKSDKLILLAATQLTPDFRAMTNLHDFQKSIDRLWRRVGKSGLAREVALPLIGTGHGGIPKADALSLLLVSLKQAVKSAESLLCNHVQIVIYAQNRLPNWARSVFAGLFEETT